MDIHSLTSAHLKQAINLYAKKEALQEQLAAVDEQISALLGGTSLVQHKGARPSSKIAKAPKGRAAKSGRRGGLKESILAELRAAGAQGVSVKELVGKLKSKSANLHAWFHVTGKNIAGLKKIGRGIYRLTE